MNGGAPFLRTAFSNFVVLYRMLTAVCSVGGGFGVVLRLQACHNGSPMGADIDTALDFLPAILCLHFAWYRIAWPSFYHKVRACSPPARS